MILQGDCLELMPTLDAESVDAVVTDPPYGLGFMGKHWDHGVPNVDFWREMYRVLKPGGHLLSFGGTRTVHRIMTNIEDAGFEIRDTLMWIYASGFPKSLDVGKAMDKVRNRMLLDCLYEEIGRARAESGLSLAAIGAQMMAHTNGQYGKWYHRGGHMFFETGISLPSRPEWSFLRELLPIDEEFVQVYDEAEREIIAQRTVKDRRGDGTVVGLGHSGKSDITAPATDLAKQWDGWGTALKPAHEPIVMARKPLVGTVAGNVARYGTGAINVDGTRIGTDGGLTRHAPNQIYGAPPANRQGIYEPDSGGYSRFFIIPKADRAERERGLADRPKSQLKTMGDGAGEWSKHGPDNPGLQRANVHPTVKPIDLMRHLVRLVTPPGGTVLDPFLGSGTTAIACELEGFQWIGMEREAEYVAIAEGRIGAVRNEPRKMELGL